MPTRAVASDPRCQPGAYIRSEDGERFYRVTRQEDVPVPVRTRLWVEDLKAEGVHDPETDDIIYPLRHLSVSEVKKDFVLVKPAAEAA